MINKARITIIHLKPRERGQHFLLINFYTFLKKLVGRYLNTGFEFQN